MGLDDEYIKKLEDQKRLREHILRKKAEARRKINTLGDTEDEISPKKIEHELLRTESGNCKATARPSIYINPKAFRGDFSALNCNLKKINVGTTEGGKQSPVVNIPSSSKVSPAVLNDGSTDNVLVKPRTILRIVKDKHGNVISRSKVQWLNQFITFVFVLIFRIHFLFSCSTKCFLNNTLQSFSDLVL